MNTKQQLLQNDSRGMGTKHAIVSAYLSRNDQNADTTLLHSHDDNLCLLIKGKNEINPHFDTVAYLWSKLLIETINQLTSYVLISN